MIESIILSFFLVSKSPQLISMPYKTYKVEGSVKNYFGNQMDYLDKKTDLKKSHKILAVEGIFPHEGDTKVKIELLDSRYKIIQTNNNGEFEVRLKPGKYTFFLIKGHQAYLNHFDGFGNFRYLDLKDDVKQYIIKDYENAYF